MGLHPGIEAQLSGWSGPGEGLAASQVEALEAIGAWVVARAAAGEPADVVWVCTHNSRRSHMAQLWAQAAAVHHGLALRSWSGGTEATAFHPSAIAAMVADGFVIADSGAREGEGNPVYEASLGPNVPVVRVWSKVFTDAPNPQSGFLAVMVCSSADEACPFVLGADQRVSLPFDDPKAADGTPEAPAVYQAASRQIGQAVAWAIGAAAR